MTIQLKDLGDGRIEMIQVRPVSLGILTSRRIAERFADFLDQMEEHELEQLSEFITGEAPPAIAAGYMLKNEGVTWRYFNSTNGTTTLASSPVQAGERAADETAPVPTNSTPEAEPKTDTPMQVAFARLEAGEKVGVVADDLGIPMPRLRSMWARRCRARKDEEAEKAEADRPSDTVSCSTCGRDYKPGASDEGLCARCTRDLGRG